MREPATDCEVRARDAGIVELAPLFESIVSAAQDAILSTTLDGVITSWNRAAEAVYGYSAEEAIGQRISIVASWARPNEMMDNLAKVRGGERVAPYEAVGVRKDGSRQTVSLGISPVHDAAGAIVGASTIGRAIPERRLAYAGVAGVSQDSLDLIEASREDALAHGRGFLNALLLGSAERRVTEERARLAAIVETSPDAIIGKRVDGVITAWNKGAERMFGYTSAEILGLHISTLVPSHLMDEECVVLEKLSRGDRVEPFESQRVRKSGEVFDASLVVSSVRDADGRIIGASKIARDITAQKQASRYARSLLEASIDPLITISPEGKITDVNEGSVKITGVAREDLIATDFCDYFTEPEKARASYRQVFSNGFVTDYPLTIRHTDGRTTDVLYNASVYKDVRGNVLGVVAAARDVTAQRRAEAEVAVERMKQLERVAELERFQKLTVDRELKMIELKKEIEMLKKQRPAEGSDR